MHIATITPERHAEFLDLVDAEIRPDRAKTHAWDDFPLILSPANAAWTLAATAPDGRLAGGIACLIREYSTTSGKVPVAGVGSVVTHPEYRGRGVSTALQNALLTRLRGKNVPLAVLWTDRPEIYAGRGFAPAGWERHVDLAEADLPTELPAGFVARPFAPGDADAVAALYDRHSLRTIRAPGDAATLYTMPGTRGLVAAGEGGGAVAAVFCGKGADFPGYVTEWSGPVGLVVPLLAAARARGWAQHVLVPPGAEQILQPLGRCGAGWGTVPSGCWAILAPDGLGRYLQAAGAGAPRDMGDPVAVLGGVDDEGQPVAGALTLAVWGFDSV